MGSAAVSKCRWSTALKVMTKNGQEGLWMETFASIIKAVAWGICVLCILAFTFFSGANAFIILGEISFQNHAPEALRTLDAVRPSVQRIVDEKRIADSLYREKDALERAKAEAIINASVKLIEEMVKPYCAKAKCISWTDQRYSFYDDIVWKREAWAEDILVMLERQAKPQELRSDNWLDVARVFCASLSCLLLLYLLGAFAGYLRIGWKRLLSLSILVAPPAFVTLGVAYAQVDPLYGSLDISGTFLTASMFVGLLYPFIVLPPLWVLNKKSGKSVANTLSYWRES